MGELIWVLGLVLAGAPDSEPPGAPEAAETAESSSALARRFFEAGEQNYAAGRYHEAIANYLRAYELSGRKALLFNVANAQERAGAYGDAAASLTLYLEGAPAIDRVAVEQRIASLEERAGTQAQIDAELEALRDYRTRASARLAQLEPDPSRPPRWPGYVVTGAGLAMLTASLVTGLVATSAGDRASENCVELEGGALCETGARSALDEERTLSAASDVLLGLGLGTAALGGVMIWLQARPGRDGGAVVGVRGAF